MGAATSTVWRASHTSCSRAGLLSPASPLSRCSRSICRHRRPRFAARRPSATPRSEPCFAHWPRIRTAAFRRLPTSPKHSHGDRTALAVLQHFEPLLDAAGEVRALPTDCPGVKILLTSQVLLRIYGEHELSGEPLAVPDPHVRLTATRAETSPAVKLFAERAAAARSDFRLDDANVHSVVEICARLDGVPLAIELAAARTRTMTPSALLAKLAQRLDLFASGARDLPLRQRTMRGAIACTHDLLRPEEQTMFRRLARVFCGAASPTRGPVPLR